MQTSAPSEATPSIASLATHLPSPYTTSSSLKDLNDTFISSAPSSAAHIFAHVRARQTLDSSSKDTNKGDISKILEKCEDTSISQAVEAVKLIRELGGEKQHIDLFVEKAMKRWPEATVIEREGARRR